METKNQKVLTPKLRFKEFKNDGDWTSRPLDELCERIRNKVGGAQLTPVSITAGRGFVSQAEKFGRDISGAQYKNYIHLRRGEFAYNKGNSNLYPQGCVYRLKEFEEAAASNAFICFTLQDGNAPGFFEGLFEKNTHGRQLIRFLTSGARSDGLLNIRPEEFFSVEFPIPPHSAEQQKIADCLTSLDETIAAQGRKVEALKDHKKGLMQQLFPREGDTLPRLRFPEFREDWEERPLITLAKYENGKAYEPDIEVNGRYVVVNSRFVSTDGAVRKHSNAQHCIAARGDVLMVLSDLPKGRALAKCFYVDEDNRYAVNQRVARLTPVDVHPKFLYYRVNRHPALLAFDDGLNQTHLSKGSVSVCALCVPRDQVEQQRIADCLGSLDARLAAEAGKLAALRGHKKGLMQQLFPSPEGD